MSEPQPLTGGRQTAGVVRIGDTVRRPRHARSDDIVQLLTELRARGFDGAPEVVAANDSGDLVLRYIDGEGPPVSPFRLNETAARSVASLVRRFHDAAATCTLAAGSETVAHGDLGPHNIVFRDGLAVAIIDWDEGVRGGSRADDFAHAVWCTADLVERDVPLEQQATLLHAMCAEYGDIPPQLVLDELAARFDRAIAQHGGAGRTKAAQIFAETAAALARTRERLLARPDPS
ncbi:hypothetical protein BH11ACT3_BH11ACT3_24160 [soil metagenome]